ncbi:MAG: bactofilin family protein [Polyangiaceae bacterium]
MSDTGAKSRESKTDVGNATGRGKALARPAAPEVWTQPKEPQSISRTVRESRLEDRLREHETTDENWTSGTSEASPALGPRTVVEQGTEFKGVFVSDCAIEVKGRVEGDVAAPSLTIAASGAVEGSVKVGELSSEGAIAGEIDADVARLYGVVKDKTVLRAKSLEMKLAPVGTRLQVTFGSAPAVTTADARGTPTKA